MKVATFGCTTPNQNCSVKCRNDLDDEILLIVLNVFCVFFKIAS